MGAFCPVPACDAAMLGQIREQVVEPTMHGLRAEGIDYRGVIYFGLMITPSGPRVLEYNVRLGDPEAEVVLPALESSLLEVMDACIDRTLDRCEPRFTPGFHVDVVLAARGYPDVYEKGHEITGLDAVDPGTLVFHAGTRREAGRVLTAGGRVINVVARGDDLDDAIARAYRQCERIHFEGQHHRSDIGRRKWCAPGEDGGKSCEKSFEEGVRGRNFSSEKFFPRERRPRRVAILISGRGSNMEAIVRNARDGVLRDCCEVALVLSDRADAAGLEIARSLGVETACLESRGRRRRDFDRALVELLDRYELDYLVLAGFMRVLTPIVIERYRDRIVNIHPADTSAYQGAHGYEWACESRLQATTITVHLVDEGVDTGRVIAQREVDLRGADTIDEVRRRGLAVEHGFYSEVLRTVLTDSRPRPRPRSDEEA
jgi:phosphoribosylglycinamide formyltransferase-1